jgi:hypothetical protein
MLVFDSHNTSSTAFSTAPEAAAERAASLDVLLSPDCCLIKLAALSLVHNYPALHAKQPSVAATAFCAIQCTWLKATAAWYYHVVHAACRIT